MSKTANIFNSLFIAIHSRRWHIMMPWTAESPLSIQSWMYIHQQGWYREK